MTTPRPLPLVTRISARVGILARALRLALVIVCAAALCLPPTRGSAVDSGTVAAKAAARVEARSADLLAIGIVQDDRMVIHLSRVIDNAPVRDAVLTVLLRGVVHPTTAEADGGYVLQSRDLALPGAADLVFQVVQANAREDLKGTLEIAGAPEKTEDKNSARQFGWWVLNFAVCIGFLLLLSRRRKAAAAAGD